MDSKKVGIAAFATMALMLSASAVARDLSVVSWGGAYQDAQRDVYFKPFMEKTKTTMTEENWDGGVGTLRAKVQGGNNNWDVVQVESEELLLGCEEGLYEKLDWAKLGGNDKYKKNFKIVWPNNLYSIDSWVIMKGSPNKAQAETFLVFVNDPQNQKNLPPKIPYGPTAKASTALIDKNVLPNLATAPQNMATALYINDKFWLENLDKLSQRFNAWVAK